MSWLDDRRTASGKKSVDTKCEVRKVGLELFSNEDVDQITELLKAVDLVTAISWEFERTRGLVVSGLDTDVGEVVLSHPRSARAYLDAYLLGYNHGKYDIENPDDEGD